MDIIPVSTELVVQDREQANKQVITTEYDVLGTKYRVLWDE